MQYASLWQREQLQPYADTRRRLLRHLHTEAEDFDASHPYGTANPHRKLASRLMACCASPEILQDNATGRLIRTSGGCGQRTCPRCGPIRAKQTAAQVAEHIATMDSPRMLTLTLASTDAPLADEIGRLILSVRNMRRRKDWKRHVTGGFMVIEITYNPKTDRWHPHAHLTIDGTYWRQSAIAQAWEDVTGDSKIVDIRVTHSRDGAARYLAKYLTKLAAVPEVPHRRVIEYIAAMKGLRVVQTFGTMHGRKTTPPKPKAPEGLKHIAPLHQLYQHAATPDDPRAARLWRRLWQATRRIPDGEPGSIAQSDARHRRIARCIRAWWEQKQGIVHREHPQNRHANAPPDPDHGTERLWEEPDAASLAIEARYF